MEVTGTSVLRSALLCVLLSMAMGGCSQKSPSDIHQAFKVTALASQGGALTVDKAKVSIAKSSLGKEFLLQVQTISQFNAPQFQAMKSRVVYFSQQSNKLYLIESSSGNLVAKNLTQKLLLAEFPILETTEDQITFDFNIGMSRIFTMTDWRSHDGDGGQPDDYYSSAKAAFSYIEEARFSTTNTLVIKQLAQVEASSGSGGSINMPLEVQYYLTPYEPDPSFTPTKATRNYNRMGFFEVSAKFNEEGGTTIYASKMDIKKPIVYAISSNTPADFKQAVRDGILYWNRAFKQDFIQVIDAPAGATAPDSDYNIVQWVDWPSAGFAYADAQMDPRTGQILHQQIYFTSAWAIYGKAQAQQLLKTLGNKKAETPRKLFGLAGFENQNLCALELTEQQIRGLDLKDDGKVLQASQDLIREVVAHEVGHTLGLRHNFAGSLGANYALSERDAKFKEYLDTGKTPEGLSTTSSVMDYIFPMDSIMVGNKMANGKPVEDYDFKAIQTLYFGKKYSAKELPLFCTDSDVGRYLDCRRYDLGTSYVEFSKYMIHNTLENLPRDMFQTFVAAKNPQYGYDPIPLEEVGFSPESVATSILNEENLFMSLFTSKADLLKVSRDFDFTNDSNRDYLRQKQVEYIQSEMGRLGGLDEIFLSAGIDITQKQAAAFESLLSNPQYIKGSAPNGKTYEFTPDELALMKQTGKQFFISLKKELLKKEVRILAGGGLDTPMATKFDKTPLSDALAQYLSRRQMTYLLQTTGEAKTYEKISVGGIVEKGGAIDNSTVRRMPMVFSEFSFPLEIRKMAAMFFFGSRAEYSEWGIIEKAAIQKSYGKMLMEAYPDLASPDRFNKASDLEALPKPAANWIMDALSVKRILD